MIPSWYLMQSIRLNADKLKLRRTEVPYIGHLLISKGLQWDPEKPSAIKRNAQTKGCKELRDL